MANFKCIEIARDKQTHRVKSLPKEFLCKLYEEKSMSLLDIAQKIGVAQSTVAYHLEKNRMY